MFVETVEIATASLPCKVRIARPEGDESTRFPAVILFMDGFGVRPALCAMQERLAAQGYVVFLPDLFYMTPDVTPEQAREALIDASKRSAFVGAYIRPAVQTEPFEVLLRSLLSLIGQRTDVAPTGIGTTGYCMGGGLSLKAAAMAPDLVKAAASFHGGNLATDAADSPHTYAPRIKAELYIGGADHDNSFPDAMKARLQEALEAARLTFTLETYAGATHGWTMADLPIHHPEMAERAWRELTSLLARRLKS